MSMRMPARVRWLPAVLVLIVVGAACTPIAAPAPTPTTKPKATTTTTTTTTLPTLPSPCGSSAPPQGVQTTFDVVVDDGQGAPEVLTVEASDAAELDGEVQAIEETVGPVTAVGRQVEVGIQAVDPSDDPYYSAAFDAPNAPTSVALQQAEFPAAWANGDDGEDIVVAIIDTGVLGTHPGLFGKLLPGTDLVDGGDGQTDPHGHGTHVAGIAAELDDAASGIGAAPGAKILPVRVLNESGSGPSTRVADGIEWAVDNGADVINLSLGGPCSDAIGAQIDYAIEQGVTVVAAAGNCGAPLADGSDGCANTVNQPVYPAAFDTPGLIAVGALNTSSTQNTKATFSNDNAYIDIAAPGTSILSTFISGSPQYLRLSGTSMATPFVSAVVALVAQGCDEEPPSVEAKIEGAASKPTNFSAATVKVVDAAATAVAACPP